MKDSRLGNHDLVALGGGAAQFELIVNAEHMQPHAYLGAHQAIVGGLEGVVVRCFQPDAESAFVLRDSQESSEMVPLGHGMFAVFLAGARLPMRYRLRFCVANGESFERGDAYRFLPTLGDMDLHLFNEGTHRRLWEVLGAHPRTIDGERGTSFAVWAPNAKRVSVVGEFSAWDGRQYQMRSMGRSGVWEIFIPGIDVGTLYKFEIKTKEGWLREKTDPMAYGMEVPPAQASRVTESTYDWGDVDWMSERHIRDWLREPMITYEVHLGSWARVPEENNRYLTYREIAPRLAEHCKKFGFTHVELMPVAEHAYYPSWGYQVTGYYAPTARYGDPDGFREFVDILHRANIGVIIDWVPAHFPKDDFALRRFDGTALYEHEDWRRGEHPDWGTLIFNYGRPEVRNFLVANALYWLREMHVDGLRVDAVASMLYLDYSRKAGQWLPNPYGGRENIDAIEFLRQFNQTIQDDIPGAFTIAEESTSWGGVSHPASWGGLGFTFKWNMGWMHDTLYFFTREPVHRKYHVDQLTFSMMYEHTEHFINSISHDEVVHGKGSLYSKMPGDHWQKLANLRQLLGYQYFRPGKQLLFMGTEIAQPREWNVETSLDWHLAEEPDRVGLRAYIAEIGRIYRALPCFWRGDPNPESYEWIDFNDRDNTVLSFLRRDSGEHAVVIFNLTPVPRADYRIGAPEAGRYRVIINSDAPRFGGSGHRPVDWIDTDPAGCHGRSQSFCLTLPPLGVLVLVPERVAAQLAPGNSGPSDVEDAGVPTLPTGAGSIRT
jgi:1,4-alpha-glucan branching enzyme